MEINDDLAEIILDFKCNSHCIFCYERRNRYFPAKTTVELKKEIKAARQKGFSRLSLIGGEPTIRPDIFELINFAKIAGFDYIMIATNGRMFNYTNFAYQMVRSGISEVIFSLHGYQAKIHDSHTGSLGGFKQLKNGIANLKRLGFDNVGINVVVVQQNYCYLPRIAKLLLKWRIRRVHFIYGSVLENFKQLTPKISKVAPYLCEALEMGKQEGYFWRILNAPMSCYFKDYLDRLSWSITQKSHLFIRTAKARLIHQAGEKLRKIWVWVKLSKCRFCNYQKECPGIWREYLKQYGDGEVKPVK